MNETREKIVFAILVIIMAGAIAGAFGWFPDSLKDGVQNVYESVVNAFEKKEAVDSKKVTEKETEETTEKIQAETETEIIFTYKIPEVNDSDKSEYEEYKEGIAVCELRTLGYDEENDVIFGEVEFFMQYNENGKLVEKSVEIAPKFMFRSVDQYDAPVITTDAVLMEDNIFKFEISVDEFVYGKRYSFELYSKYITENDNFIVEVNDEKYIIAQGAIVNNGKSYVHYAIGGVFYINCK